ncbi:allophanate hydrolase [Agrobacterium rosae]|uniref:Allophanate hydrolase n=1 Tax=Agrobacterium rosae TaxID=1972867 RepID=A0AAE5RY56_9HYPH|nr:allophanate hydrolase [Agrobacterium rosae]KAA3511432.1 allophanate hydrolase [Agrobacterium rosae]KAA3519144.1 allophanate hydrolase [Agrobacterium rosae]MBN7806965.1 allophanate hydrolase [Agrobacterium rosae]MCM2436214.1 allophanate hydrolase [Agrobacterium rosae]MDX8332253.1 allophanate hydrolase [Agrobacterium rosae]
MFPAFLDLSSLKALYANGTSPLDLVEEVLNRIAASDDPAIFISKTSADDLRHAARALMAKAPEPNSLPLWGIPFAVKDNIDVAGLPTTAACPAFAYQPENDATVVARLKAAGGLVIGKTNLDQFATGLNGTRSPYGAPRSVFDKAYVSGGSSSGSSVAVASGLASFALGTDTAGSGRVPAAFNNIVGIKPTPGLVPNVGVVPACRSVDVVTVFAGTVGDGVAIRAVMDGYDPADPFSKVAKPVGLPSSVLKVGVLTQGEREFYGNSAYEALYDAAIERAKALGAEIVPFDYAPFREAAELLYNGPWVAERLASVKDFFVSNATDFDPAVRSIISGATQYSAVDAFEGLYRLEALRQKTLAESEKPDVLMLPTSPTTYTVDAMLEQPIVRNGHFGRYTNFANLFGYAAIAIPAGFDPDGHLPAGVTLFGPAFSDDALAPFADAMHRALAPGMGRDTSATLPDASRVMEVDDGLVPIVVVGAHLSGMPLNHELTRPGGRLVKACRTAANYRLFVLPNTTPPKPGLIRAPGFAGPGLSVEVWKVTPEAFGHFVQNIPAPLGIGKVTLDDGSQVSGFLCEPYATEGAREVTHHGGWRAYIQSIKP